MKFGLVYPSSSAYVDTELLRLTAKKAEDSGFEIFLVWDHYLLPKSANLPWSNRTLEAYETLSFVAALTTKIKLSTIVSPIPFRNILELAKITSFLDFLSNHRFVLGAGLGWNETEFRFYSEWKSPAERFKTTENGLRTILAMWDGSTSNPDLPEIDPRPGSQTQIPIWFGSMGKRMLRLCAELGSGWIPSSIPASDFSSKVDLISSLLKSNGRSVENFTFATDLEDPLFQKRSADEIISKIEEYKNSGSNLICQTWQCDPLDRKSFLDRIEWYSKEVMSSFSH